MQPLAQPERRFFTADKIAAVRVEGTAPRIAGHAAVFNQKADLGWYDEIIMPGAFRDAIASDDVRALLNHDPNFVLGRNKAGTLRLAEDAIGLAMENDTPDTQWARDLLVSIDRRDIDQMSFGFFVINQRWETKDGRDLRIIEKVSLFDVSVVTFPAYPQTDVAQRAREEWQKSLAPVAAPLAALEPFERTLALQEKS